MYPWSYRCYQRQFSQPLQTHHGVWAVREGIILRLQGPGATVGFGEIAPLPWFGSETLDQALAFCRQLPPVLTPELLLTIPESLPGCQFGFACAWAELKNQPSVSPTPTVAKPENCCGLLPTGAAALSAWVPLWQQGYRTLKWKIGVQPPALELAIFEQLMQKLPSEVKLRLDANGGLDPATTERWLETCNPEQVEYLEQPLTNEAFGTMLSLARESPIPLALDESVASLPQLLACQQRGWPGIFVLKPAILGDPGKLRQFCQQHQPDLVLSSGFETGIGRRVLLELAAELTAGKRALGWGGDWFADSLDRASTPAERELLWQSLEHGIN